MTPRLTPQERSLRSRMAAHAMHAKHDSREVTTNARAAFMSKFEDQVDPDRVLSGPERLRRAEHARKAYFTGLALKSVRSRRREDETSPAR